MQSITCLLSAEHRQNESLFLRHEIDAFKLGMRRAPPRWMWLAALLLPAGAFAADLEFAGSLERITQDTILIWLADGKRIDAKIPKTGALAAATISAQFKLGDEVQITCKPMGDRCLDLKSLKFLRPPTPKERALVLGTPMPAGAAGSRELEHARRVNLDRAATDPGTHSHQRQAVEQRDSGAQMDA